MIKRPRNLKLCGRRIKVAYSIPSTHDPSIIMGLHYGMNNKICINPDASEDQQKATMVHEICHDIEQTCGIAVSEQDITSFSSVLFSVLRDNPHLVAWLMSK